MIACLAVNDPYVMSAWGEAVGAAGKVHRASVHQENMSVQYPLKPHFYIAKLGYAGLYLFLAHLSR